MAKVQRNILQELNMVVYMRVLNYVGLLPSKLNANGELRLSALSLWLGRTFIAYSIISHINYYLHLATFLMKWTNIIHHIRVFLQLFTIIIVQYTAKGRIHILKDFVTIMRECTCMRQPQLDLLTRICYALFALHLTAMGTLCVCATLEFSHLHTQIVIPLYILGFIISISTQAAWLSDRLQLLNTVLKSDCKSIFEKEQDVRGAVKTLRLTRSYARSLNNESGAAAIATIVCFTYTTGLNLCFTIMNMRKDKWSYVLKDILGASHTAISLFFFLSSYTNLEYQWLETLATLEKSVMEMRENDEILNNLDLWAREVKLLNALPIKFQYHLWFHFNSHLIATVANVVVTYTILFVQIQYNLI